MQKRVSFLNLLGVNKLSAVLLLLALSVFCLAAGSIARAQTVDLKPAATSLATAPVSAAPAVASSPNWVELSREQQQALLPLASAWDGLSAGHRRKWIALTKNYASLGENGKSKLNERMVEWASLSPKDRELARLNFAETKKLAPANRSADWEAYQALTAEEKQKLAAERAKRKPNSAAIAIKPVPKDKLTAVPVTRRSPETARDLIAAKQALDRNTLLPKLVPAVATPNTTEK